MRSLIKGLSATGLEDNYDYKENNGGRFENRAWIRPQRKPTPFDYMLALERVGPAADDRCYTMRGIDVTERAGSRHQLFLQESSGRVRRHTIGIGDGGNEIGMGKI